MRTALLMALLASCVAAQTSETGSGEPKPGPADRVLLYGQGLWCADIESKSITAWLGPEHPVSGACGLLDRGCGINTVFALSDGQVERLSADSGRPVSVIGQQGDDDRPVQSGRVLQLADCIDLGTIELLADATTGTSQPAFGSYIPSLAFTDEPSFAMVPRLTQLDRAPDRLFMNYPLWSAKLGNAVFMKLPAGEDQRLSCWTRSGQALGDLELSRFGEGARLLDVAVPTHAPSLFAVAADPSGELKLGSWDFDPDRRAGDWTIHDLKLRADSSPLRMAVTHAGDEVLLGQSETVFTVTTASFSGIPDWHMSEVLAASEHSPVTRCSVTDLCLLWTPSTDGFPPHAPLSPGATGRRSETRLAVLVHWTDAASAREGNALLILGLQPESIVWVQDVPAGVSRIARLPMETCAG